MYEVCNKGGFVQCVCSDSESLELVVPKVELLQPLPPIIL